MMIPIGFNLQYSILKLSYVNLPHYTIDTKKTRSNSFRYAIPVIKITDSYLKQIFLSSSLQNCLNNSIVEHCILISTYNIEQRNDISDVIIYILLKQVPTLVTTCPCTDKSHYGPRVGNTFLIWFPFLYIMRLGETADRYCALQKLPF